MSRKSGQFTKMHQSALIELEAVLAVARVGGFRAAARALDMSPTALSRCIAQLETRLGVRLFNRTTRSVALSAAGEQFVAMVGPALAEIQQAMTAVNNAHSAPSGLLRINCSLGAARAVLVPVVLAFLRQFPAMRIDLVTESELSDIVGKGFDAGIRTAGSVPRDMIAVPFGGDLSFCVVGSPDYLAKRGSPITPPDLRAHQCIRTRWPSGKLYLWDFERDGEKVEIDVPGELTLDEASLMRDAALSGAGLAYLWRDSINAELADGRLVAVLDDWQYTSPGLCLYYPDRRHVPTSLRAFIALLRNAFPN
jgi:DNA-binding transcriptional LysR family regulator